MRWAACGRRSTTAGRALWPISYDPWGNVERSQLSPGTGGLPVAGFTGELHDPVMELVYLRARWYSTTKRYVYSEAIHLRAILTGPIVSIRIVIPVIILLIELTQLAAGGGEQVMHY